MESISNFKIPMESMSNLDLIITHWAAYAPSLFFKTRGKGSNSGSQLNSSWRLVLAEI